MRNLARKKMEDFLMEILELTEEGQKLLRAKINYWSQYCTSI